MTLAPRLLFLACALFAHPLAHADVVAEWNKTALDTIGRSGAQIEQKLHAMAMVHVAMFEALNFVQARYTPRFVVKSGPLQGVSAQAATAAAAHHVLTQLHPEQSVALAAALARSLRRLGDREAVPSGVVTGTSIASVVCAASALMPVREEKDRYASSVRSDATRGRALPKMEGLWLLTTPLSWNPMVAELIAVKRLSSIDGARIHALVSMVSADAYVAARATGHPCASCIAAAAIAATLEAQFAPAAANSEPVEDAQELGRQIGAFASRNYFRPLAPPDPRSRRGAG